MSALLWTFPLLMLASIIIGWAAEITAVHFSAGIALAVLAWLQTAPEFAVEATIAWHRDAHLALANLSGSLRLLLGFGWPMVFFIHWASAANRARRGAGSVGWFHVVLPESFAVEAVGLAIPAVYFLIIYFKGNWGPIDGVILCGFYVIYLVLLSRGRGRLKAVSHEQTPEAEDEGWVVRKVLAARPGTQFAGVAGLFALGGLGLWVTVHPFLDALKGVAAAVGVSDFIFVQWVAPLASEFPEKVTAFGWARRPGKVSMAIVNMVASVTSQWTLLAGMIPIIFSLSAGHSYVIEFSSFQKGELLLTVAQTMVAVAMLADLKVTAPEMAGFFVLWAVQFFAPSSRPYLIPLYFSWAVLELAPLLLKPSRCAAWVGFRKILRT